MLGPPHTKQGLANTAWAFAMTNKSDAMLFGMLARAAQYRIGDIHVQGLVGTKPRVGKPRVGSGSGFGGPGGGSGGPGGGFFLVVTVLALPLLYCHHETTARTTKTSTRTHSGFTPYRDCTPGRFFSGHWKANRATKHIGRGYMIVGFG